MEFTVCAVLVSVLVADCVAIGTWSPTCRRAEPLLRTRRFGDDSTRTSVFVASAFKTTSAALPPAYPRLAPGTNGKPGKVTPNAGGGSAEPPSGRTFGPKI